MNTLGLRIAPLAASGLGCSDFIGLDASRKREKRIGIGRRCGADFLRIVILADYQAQTEATV